MRWYVETAHGGATQANEQRIVNDLVGTSLPTGVVLLPSRRRHTRSLCDWSSDVCSSDLEGRDLLFGDVQVDALEGVELAVVEVQVANRQLGGVQRGGRGRSHCVILVLVDCLLLHYFWRVRNRARILRPSTATVIRNTPAQASCCQFS